MFVLPFFFFFTIFMLQGPPCLTLLPWRQYTAELDKRNYLQYACPNNPSLSTEMNKLQITRLKSN